MSNAEKLKTRVLTPIARLSYPALFEPKAAEEGQDKKYSCELIFDSNTDLSELKKAAADAVKNKWGDKPPKGLRSPFRDGDDREGKDGYEGKVFIGARSKDRPGVIIGRDKHVCTDQSDVYGGCYVRASVTAFAYETKGNKGVSFALNNVWKVKDGDPFGSRMNAEDEFADEELDADAFGEDSASDDGDLFGDGVPF